MPLIKSAGKKAFSKNVAKERDAGKPEKQAVAIAENVKRGAGRSKGSDPPPGPNYGRVLRNARKMADL